jgi:hypothetical protein
LRCARLNVAKVNSERSKGRAKILVNVLKGAKVTVSRLVELVYLMLPAYAAGGLRAEVGPCGLLIGHLHASAQTATRPEKIMMGATGSR